MDIILKLKEELNVEKWQVEAAVKLIDEGNTIPFISIMISPMVITLAIFVISFLVDCLFFRNILLSVLGVFPTSVLKIFPDFCSQNFPASV